MDVVEAELLAQELMNKHGLIDNGWYFEWAGGSKSRHGDCTYILRRIRMTKASVLVADEEWVTQVMLHEIAHALLPPEIDGKTVGHGPLWKAKAKAIGYTGGRTGMNMSQLDELTRFKNLQANEEIYPGWLISDKTKSSINDFVWVAELKICIVQKVGRTRYTVYSPVRKDSFTVLFEHARAVKPSNSSMNLSKFTPMTQILPPLSTFSVGTEVRINDPHSRTWHGRSGVIVKVNPKKYVVDIKTSTEVVRVLVPHSLAEPI